MKPKRETVEERRAYCAGVAAGTRQTYRRIRNSYGAKMEAALMGEVPHFEQGPEAEAELLLLDEDLDHERRLQRL